MQVNENTVTIKKSPRSTFNHYHTHSGSGRIGDLNVVWHKMMMPADMIRCRVDSSIQFISPLSVPAFARMKVYTYYFFQAYQNVQSDFNDMIMNYEHKDKYELVNGDLHYFGNYNSTHMSIRDFTVYFNTALCFGKDFDTYTHSSASQAFKSAIDTNTPSLKDFVYQTFEQRVNIEHLCSQMGFPKSCLLLPYSDLLSYYNSVIYPDNTNFSKTSTSDSVTVNILTSAGNNVFSNALKIFQFYPYYKSYKNFSGDYPRIHINTIINSTDDFNFSLLPFKVYQSIYNDWFINPVTNSPIDIYPDVINHGFAAQNQIYTYNFKLYANSLDDGNSTYDKGVFIDDNYLYQYAYDYETNFMFNSLFQIRQPWYAKDYFNTASPDPTLGVSSYSLGSSVVELRKQSALQRLAEKKALCGNRFIDFLAQHFNIYPDSLEIGRSIHLGTDVGYVSVNEVLQTSETTSSSPQGERAAVARGHANTRGVFFKAPTYGEFMILQCIKPQIDYYNGMPRELTIVDAADFPLPELAQIGMDTIFKRELVISANRMSGQNNNAAFGYCPRYSWQKSSLNQVSGRLAYDLEFWHQSPDLRLSKANLNYQFGQIGFDAFYNSGFDNTTYPTPSFRKTPSYNRIFAVDDYNEDTYVYIHDINATLSTCLPSNDMPQL